VVLLAVTLPTLFGKEPTEDAAVLPTRAPYDELTPKCDELGKWGYVRVEDAIADKGVAWSIRPAFDAAALFQEGVAGVKVGSQWGFIDEDGRFLVQPRFSEVSDFVGGYAPVRTSAGWGYVNRQCKLVIPPQYEEASPFSEGLAPVSKGGKWGYINTLGAFVISPQFDDAAMFSEGIAAVRRGARMTYILRDGKPLTDSLFDRAETFRYGRAAVMSENRWGVLDSFGHLIVPFQFEDISSQYSEGLAAAKSNGKWGFIDLRGTWVIQPTYDKANDFAHGLAVVVQGNKLCVVDPVGNVKRSYAIPARAEREKHAGPSCCEKNVFRK
jgi:hypothetical protein